MTWFLGLLAGVIGITAYVPYVRDILLRRTHPERASWLIWSIEYCALFMAQIAKGASNSLWLIGLQLLGVAGISILSVRYGAGTFTKRDHTLLAAACAALIAWYFTDNASVAIMLLIGIEIAAVVPTIIKVYHSPDSETLATWALIGIAGVIALPAVGGAHPILYAYPVSLIGINFGVVAAAFRGRKAHAGRAAGLQETL